MRTDTIFALATARGKAGVAIVRISGPEAWAALGKLVGKIPEPRLASVRRISDGRGGLIDEALVLVFAQGHSFTGEESAEIHLHGGPAIARAVFQELSEIQGLRVAEPGEFTRRALENDRLDVAQVEGLSDLIEAETETQRVQALRVFQGELAHQVGEWRKKLVRSLALVEATIDFADEEIPDGLFEEVAALVDEAVSTLKSHVSGANFSERVRNGFEVAILGPPNAGKSTLLNRLANREAAITSEIAGTTRDIVEVGMDLAGLPVTFLDTAGLRETSDVIESIGIRRALERAETADLRIILSVDGERPTGVTAREFDIVVTAKADLGGQGDWAVSGKTGTGISELLAEITRRLESRNSGSIFIRDRHVQAAETALACLLTARSRLEGQEPAEIIAENLRQALRALDSLVGRVDVEDVLDEIFASFCLGK